MHFIYIQLKKRNINNPLISSQNVNRFIQMMAADR